MYISFINFALHLVLSGQLRDGEEAMRKTNPAFAANCKRRIFYNLWF